MNKSELTSWLKTRAHDLGFLSIGISKAEHMDEEALRLEKWLSQGFHGEMSYMENHFEKRVDPTTLVPGSQSVISLSYNYYTTEKQSDPESPKISKYAFGEDYHKVVKDKLFQLLFDLQEKVGDVNGRCFVDSAPVLERDWAKRSGLGWIGKHTLILSKKQGSFFFLAELILDVEFDYDHPVKDHCGTCTSCIDACPTDAISKEGYVLDASKCISYLTIELQDDIPTEFANKMDNWMFGCDICQDVCPWNRFAHQHTEPKFEPHTSLLHMKNKEWTELTQELFGELFKKSAVKRTKYAGLKRNIAFLNSQKSEI